MAKLSVVIMAFNEEAKIEECLKSVKDLADEIIFVDNESSDDTKSIAKKYTKQIYSQKNDPQNIDIQKNFGFSKATAEWILGLDADERLTPELAKEIKLILENADNEINGYWIPRKNIIFGKWIEHTGWYPDFQLRLFRNGKGKYIAKHVHEDLSVEGKTARLNSPLVHQHIQTVQDFIRMMTRYIPNEAEERLRKEYQFSYVDCIRFPANEFLSRFFAREGYKDGLHGLSLSLLMAAYHLFVFIHLWEQKKFTEVHAGRFFDTIQDEFEKAVRETRYWFVSEKIKQIKNPFQKLLLQLKRKLS